jgi:hypothetical protein
LATLTGFEPREQLREIARFPLKFAVLASEIVRKTRARKGHRLPEGVACFAGDLSEQEQKVVWATHFAPAADLFTKNVAGTAWKSKPSWYIVGTNDRTVQPELQRLQLLKF